MAREPLIVREPVLLVTGVAAAVVAAIQAVLPYLPEFGIPSKFVTLLTTIIGLIGAGAVARSRVVSPATWKAQTGRPVPSKKDLPPASPAL